MKRATTAGKSGPTAGEKSSANSRQCELKLGEVVTTIPTIYSSVGNVERRAEHGSRWSVSSAAEDSRDAVRRAEDLCRNQGGSRIEHCQPSCGDATTGACDSEGTENGGCLTASVH